ncbi:MAG: hypothetical protein R3Y21_03835 [Mycoplasmatota bacterium]
MNNKIKVAGTITRIGLEGVSVNGNKYLNFDIAINNSFITIKVYKELLEKYKEYIKIGKNVEIQGYLNSYISKNIRITYICLSELNVLKKENKQFSLNEEGDIEYWNGKKIEKVESSEEEIKELEEMLSVFKEAEYGV